MLSFERRSRFYWRNRQYVFYKKLFLFEEIAYRLCCGFAFACAAATITIDKDSPFWGEPTTGSVIPTFLRVLMGLLAVFVCFVCMGITTEKMRKVYMKEHKRRKAIKNIEG
jgi:hypothetical protein